jgi:hypothetical protein
MKHKFILLFVLLSGCLAAQTKESFSVIAFGDMPYFLPEDFSRFENLIRAVNTQTQVFNVHVGDIKSGKTPCTDEYNKKILDYFEQFKKPLIYTPGDNEWTDCGKVNTGSYDPEERLSALRKLFFQNSTSLGKEKMSLVSQSENSSFKKFVENRRWDYNTVSFGTVHLVGSDNYFLPDSKNHNQEFFERDDANVAWLNEIFNHAKKENSAGIILFTQADMFKKDKPLLGFERILRELKKLTIEFQKPVVLVHGDSHEFIVDKPFTDEKSHRAIANFTRVQVFGEYDMHAVKLIVNPKSSSLIQVEQFIVEGN